MDHSRILEALLFYRAEPLARGDIARLLHCDAEAAAEAVRALARALEGRGVVLIEVDDTVALATAPEASEVIEKLRKDELARDLGKAGAETLAIILYRGPASRADIDFIRGVNSTFILRNLQIRGLIQKQASAQGRGTVYEATPELLAHLGVSRRTDLPEYDEIRTRIATYHAAAATDSTTAP